MAGKVGFKCTSGTPETIPESIVTGLGLAFPGIHTRTTDIVAVSRAMKAHRKDTLCRLPFCATLEAEALGAEINLGDEKHGPRVGTYRFSSLEAMADLQAPDLFKGRTGQVLGAVRILKNLDETVCLGIEGPFTVLSSLVEPGMIFRGIRRQKDMIDRILNVIEDTIVRYALEGMGQGARILSFADPAGSLDIVGPGIYRDVTGKSTCRVLKRLLQGSGNAVIHVCGKTSVALEQTGFCTSEPGGYEQGLTYGEALCNLEKAGSGIRVAGHNCIKRTPLKIRNPIVWILQLT